MQPVAKAPRRYFIELNGAMVLFFFALYTGVWAHNHAGLAPALKTALTLLPIAPILLVALAIYRYYARVDEFQKRRLLEMMAIGSAVTAVFSMCWIFIEALGAPRLELFWSWPIMGLSWIAVGAVRGWSDKASEGKLGKALAFWAVTIALVGAVTAFYGFVAPKLGLPGEPHVLLLVGTAVFLIRVAPFYFSKNGAC